jgi:hypothetical protein
MNLKKAPFNSKQKFKPILSQSKCWTKLVLLFQTKLEEINFILFNLEAQLHDGAWFLDLYKKRTKPHR